MKSLFAVIGLCGMLGVNVTPDAEGHYLVNSLELQHLEYGGKLLSYAYFDCIEVNTEQSKQAMAIFEIDYKIDFNICFTTYQPFYHNYIELNEIGFDYSTQVYVGTNEGYAEYSDYTHYYTFPSPQKVYVSGNSTAYGGLPQNALLRLTMDINVVDDDIRVYNNFTYQGTTYGITNYLDGNYNYFDTYQLTYIDNGVRDFNYDLSQFIRQIYESNLAWGEYNFQLGYTNGADYESGYADGYQEGKRIGLISGGGISDGISMIGRISDGLASILGLEVLPGITLGLCISIPILLSVIIVIFNIARG